MKAILDTSIVRARTKLLRFFICLLPAAGLCSCAVGPQPVLTTPQESVGAMREAFFRDDASLFIHCLGQPVLSEYSAHTLRVGWSEIRPRVGAFVEKARVVSVDPYTPPVLEPLPPAGYVRPSAGAQARVVVLELDGRRERFLFQREVDPPLETARQSKGFWIGDRYYVRSEHPSADTYLVDDSPEKDRTHWRLVFPYEPFQRNGELTRLLQETLASEKK